MFVCYVLLTRSVGANFSIKPFFHLPSSHFQKYTLHASLAAACKFSKNLGRDHAPILICVKMSRNVPLRNFDHIIGIKYYLVTKKIKYSSCTVQGYSYTYSSIHLQLVVLVQLSQIKQLLSSLSWACQWRLDIHLMSTISIIRSINERRILTSRVTVPSNRLLSWLSTQTLFAQIIMK